MNDRLQAFLDAYERKPWTPGGDVDCCLILAEWAMWLGYQDPAAHLRGAYGRGQGQIDILVARGGALALVGSCASAIGGKRIQYPSCGDIGVVGSLTNITRQFGVIYDGSGWLTRTQRGFDRVYAKTLAAWKI